jgi:hypothetical protein
MFGVVRKLLKVFDIYGQLHREQVGLLQHLQLL